MIGFENQLNTKEQRDIFLFLDVNSRGSKSVQDIEKTFSSCTEKYPNAVNFEWFDSLKIAVCEHFLSSDKRVDYYSISSFLSTVERKYIGYAILIGERQIKGLSQFTEQELSLPHMQWIKEIDRKIKLYSETHPDLHRSVYLAMAKYSSLDGLTDQELIELITHFRSQECPYNTGMDLESWIEWYETSKLKFNDSNLPVEKESKRMLETLTTWKDDSLEDNLYWLCRNYEIHPFHENMTKDWIINCREEIAKTA